MNCTITVYLDTELVARIERVAEQQDKTRTAVIREALESVFPRVPPANGSELGDGERT